MIKEFKEFNKIIISNINQSEDFNSILNIFIISFGSHSNEKSIKKFLDEEINWKISKKATINGKIVGCYLLNNTSIYEYLSKNSKFEDYKNKRGIQGMGLAVLPEFKGMGIGKKLRKIPYEMEYDYIWGRHLKSLKNIHHWIKFGRRVVFNGKDKDGKEIYITLADLN